MKSQFVSHNPLPNIACRRTVCHVSFRGIFPLEFIFPFRQPVLVATRPLTQTVRHLASNLFAVELVLKLAFRFYNLGRSSQQSCFGSVYSRLAFQSFLHQVWLFQQVFNQALFTNSKLVHHFNLQTV